jgi:nicotinamidase-related amidase
MPLLDRDDSVLVIIDAQPGFLACEADSAVERMAWLVALAARLGIPMVATEEEPERNGATDARVAERLPADAPVFTKPTFGLAGTPEILEAVRATGRGTVVLVGCETDVCVAQSAVGLRAAGFACVVVEDATFSPGEMHERGLARLAIDGVARNHAKGVTYEWLRTVEDAHAVLGDSVLPPAPFRL